MSAASNQAAFPSQDASSEATNSIRPIGAGGASAGQDVKGAMLDPSAANKNWVKVAAIIAGIAVLSSSSTLLPAQVGKFAHLVAFGLWLGTNVWVSVGGVIMFKNLPRQTFGKLQAKLFPAYFAFSVAAVAVQLGTLALGSSVVPTAIWGALGITFVSYLVNWLAVEPAATHVMLERYQLENAPNRDGGEIKRLYQKFSKLHGTSSMLNLVCLVGAAVHGWWLASQLTIAI